MARKSKNGRRSFRNGKTGPLSKRDSRRLTPAQQEAVVRTFFTIGTIHGTAVQLGCSENAVRTALREMQNDPALAAARGQAIDEMAGRISAVTNQVIDSITPDELVTVRRDVRDRQGNLIRTVVDGPSLKDKALAIGILADKQKVLIDAKARATEAAGFGANGTGLMLPETIEEKTRLVASMVKRLRVIDVFVRDDVVQANVSSMLNKVGVREQDIAEADFEPASSVAPFD